MNVTLRGMQPSDLEPVAELAQQTFKDMYPFDWLSNAQALLAGCETGKVFVGVGKAQRDVAGYCNLSSLSVVGAGQALGARQAQRKPRREPSSQRICCRRRPQQQYCGGQRSATPRPARQSTFSVSSAAGTLEYRETYRRR